MQPPFTLLCILFLWGKGWEESNSYMFSSLVSFAYYPSVISFNLIPLSLFSLLRYLKSGKKLYSFGYIVLSSFIVLNHPFTGLLYFFITLVLILTGGYAQKKPSPFLPSLSSSLLDLPFSGPIIPSLTVYTPLCQERQDNSGTTILPMNTFILISSLGLDQHS